MELELELNSIYSEIGTLINEMIPTAWNEFYFHGELKDGDGEVYFFYSLKSNPEKMQYCYFIPDDFKVNREVYEELEDELFDLLIKLQETFKANEQELWYSFTMHVKSDGKMDAYFDYVNWNDTEYGPTDRKKYFQHKYMGVNFEDEDSQLLMNNMEKYDAL